MPEVRTALAAFYLRAHHAVTRVRFFFYILGINGLEKAGPPRAGFELRLGTEERLSAADTVVHSRIVIVPVLAGKRALSSFLARHFVLDGRQLFLPLGIGLRHLCHCRFLFHGSLCRLSGFFLTISRIGFLAGPR